MDHQQHPLDDTAIDRIAATVEREGPRIIKRAQTVRQLTRGAVAMGVVAAVGIALFLVRPKQEVRTPGASQPLACANMALPDVSRFVEEGRTVTRVGARALLSGAPGAEIEISRLQPCDLSLQLTSGEVTVHAADLAGGELRVVFPGGTARVLGTKFSVALLGDEVEVAVAEGEVEVQTTRESQRVRRGARLSHTKRGLRRSVLSQDAVETIERRLQPRRSEPVSEVVATPERPQRVPQVSKRKRRKVAKHRSRKPVRIAPQRPEPTAEELVALAQAARKSGRLTEARSLFRRAGQLGGLTAEAAWIGLARMELSRQRARATLEALAERERRFAGGSLGPEAAWIRVRALDKLGQRSEAIDEAKRLNNRWPQSRQSKAAQRWLQDQAQR